MHADYETAAGTLGTNRETMKHNTLLLRAPVGKPTCWGDDVDNCTYGIVSSKLGGVPDALNWSSTALLPKRRRGDFSQRDFVALNKAAICSGLSSARQIQDFRTTHDIRRGLATDRDSNLTPSRAYANLVAGTTKPQPSEVMWDVIAMRYQTEWINRIKQKQDIEASKKSSRAVSALSKFYETRSSVLKQYKDEAELPVWKLPEFDTAKPKVETYRGECSARKEKQQRSKTWCAETQHGSKNGN